jgi:CRP-like cAMP-binding protein
MFDTLLQLPLFQGISHEDLTSILDKVKLHFAQHKGGETFIPAGRPCDRLCFLMKGELIVTTRSDEGILTLVERATAPYVVEPHSLFGMSTRYVASYTASAEAHTVSIDKAYVMDLLLGYDIFRLNYMNIVSNRAQALRAQIWQEPAAGLRERILAFFLSRCEKSAGVKVFKIKMEDLAHYVDDTRLNTSRILNAMQAEGLLELRRKEIVIPEIRLLAAIPTR